MQDLHANGNGKSVKIFIADSSPIVRYGLKRLFANEHGCLVVAEAATSDALLPLMETRTADVLLLDFTLPGSIWQILKQLHAHKSGLRIILLASTIDSRQIREAVRLGVRGILSREAAPEMIVKSVRSVMTGQYWIDRKTAADLATAEKSPAPVRTNGASKYGLTNREMQIVTILLGGCTNKEAAQKFDLSEQTVKHHVSHIFEKLGVSTRLELAVFAFNNGLPGAERIQPQAPASAPTVRRAM